MRVLVVGAGPAGLSAAMYLTERGHEVVVVEKEDQVGGKCRNFEYEGYAYDLGANLTTPRYTLIRPLAERLGVKLKSMPERRVVNVGPGEPPSLSGAPLPAQALLRAVAHWYVFSRNLQRLDQDGYAALPDAVGRPFSEWLQRHGLGPVRPIFANLFIAYGYGVMDALPAAYALKFFDKVHLTSAIDTILGEDVQTTLVFEGGFQLLWKRVVEHYRLDVRLCTRIERIERGDRVVARWGGEEHLFDRLILACPFDATLSFLDATDEERDLFGQIRYYDYYVTAARLRDVPDISTFVHPYATSFTPGWPTVFYPPIPEDPWDVFMFYSYGDKDTTVDEVRRNIERTIESEHFQGELVEILHTQKWRYFPHVDSGAFRAGFYERFEAMQGAKHTLYTGELLSFTLVELVARYSKALVERWF